MGRFAAADPLAEPGTIVVFEAAPRWAPELQRQLPADRVTVRLRTRGSETVAALAEPLVKLLVVDLQQNEAAVLQLLGRRWRGTLRDIPCLAIAPRRDRGLEWTLRELGVDEYYEQPVRVDRLVRQICRIYLNAESASRAH